MSLFQGGQETHWDVCACFSQVLNSLCSQRQGHRDAGLPGTEIQRDWAPRDRDSGMLGSWGQGHRGAGLPASQLGWAKDPSPTVEAQGCCWCLSTNVTTVLSPKWRSGPHFKVKERGNVEHFVPQTPRQRFLPHLPSCAPYSIKGWMLGWLKGRIKRRMLGLIKGWMKGQMKGGMAEGMAAPGTGQGGWAEATARRSLAVPSSGCCLAQAAAPKEEGRKEDREQRNKTFFITALDRYYIVL